MGPPDATAPDAGDRAIEAGLSAAVRALVPPLAAAGLAWARGAAPPAFAIAAGPGVTLRPDTLWRAASLSKMVTARTLAALGGPGIWEVEASEALGWPLRHPRHPKTPITLGMVASHAASLSDAGSYAVPAATPLRDWLAERGEAAWRPEAPGAALAYANLGSLILAASAERLGGASFDRLARARVLGPMGLDGGFQWSGVPPARRLNRMAALRREPSGTFRPQVDGEVPALGLLAPQGGALDEAALLPPGENPSPLSPQGGLRLSLRGALALARAAGEGSPAWARAPAEPMLAGGTAPGLIRLDDPGLFPRPLSGHFADAYGILAGAWSDGETSFAYVLNGLDLGDEGDGWRPCELALFARLADSFG